MANLVNRDIDFYIASNLSNLLQNKLKYGHTNLNHIVEKGYAHISHIATAREGMCVLLSTNLPTRKPEEIILLLILMNNSVKNEDIPKSFNIYLTDQRSWQGIVHNDWLYVEPNSFELPMKYRNEVSIYSVKARATKLKFLHGYEDPNQCQRQVLKKAN